MTERKVRVHRLDVAYPPGSLEPGWQPPDWWDPVANGPQQEEDDFRWPKNRLYFSAASASKRAGLLRKYGATVTIEKSYPVAWPTTTDAAAEVAGQETPNGKT